MSWLVPTGSRASGEAYQPLTLRRLRFRHVATRDASCKRTCPGRISPGSAADQGAGNDGGASVGPAPQVVSGVRLTVKSSWAPVSDTVAGSQGQL